MVRTIGNRVIKPVIKVLLIYLNIGHPLVLSRANCDYFIFVAWKWLLKK